MVIICSCYNIIKFSFVLSRITVQQWRKRLYNYMREICYIEPETLLIGHQHYVAQSQISKSRILSWMARRGSNYLATIARSLSANWSSWPIQSKIQVNIKYLCVCVCVCVHIYVFLSEYTLPRRAPRVIPAEIQFVIRLYARYFIMSRHRKKSHWDAQTFSSGTT